jgi:hypothetical protein
MRPRLENDEPSSVLIKATSCLPYNQDCKAIQDRHLSIPGETQANTVDASEKVKFVADYVRPVFERLTTEEAHPCW